MPDVLFWVMVLYSLLSVFGTIAAVVSVFTSDWS